MIEKFISQDDELEAFITGPAGSGKTTNLAETIEYLDKQKITYQVVAYTHKAKDVLISKLPKNTPVSTLHSWLKKRPGINEKAKHLRTLLTSKQYGKPEHLELLIVDEFSFVGEKDYFSIGELQDEFQLLSVLEVDVCLDCDSKDVVQLTDTLWHCNNCGNKDANVDAVLPKDAVVPKPLKVLYIGDLNQLSPIDGASAVEPHEPFWTQLITIYRQDSPGLQEPLANLVDMLEGNRPMAYLEPTEDFIRGADIDKEFKACDSDSKIMLAYTNQAVQAHNIVIQGYDFPKSGDIVYNSSTKEEFTWECTRNLEDSMELYTPTGIITKDTKYNPFRELRKNKDIIYVQTSRGLIIPCLFGVYNNKIKRQQIGLNLTNANNQNKSETIKKNAYKAFKVLNDFVSVVDFSHCQTVHKSQGQEFDYVFVDSKNLSVCKDKQEMMRLLYVALSRAKLKIFLNN